MDIIAEIFKFIGDNLTESGSITGAVISYYAVYQRYGKKQAVAEGIRFERIAKELSTMGKDASLKKAREEGLIE